MDVNKRVTSARPRHVKEQISDKTDPEKRDRQDPEQQDRLWKELVWGERRKIREWEKNWGFLRNYDQMGQLKPSEPLPSDASLYSDRVPNTTNQVFGSRLSTPLGSELVRLDKLFLWTGGYRKHKLDQELLPC